MRKLILNKKIIFTLILIFIATTHFPLGASLVFAQAQTLAHPSVGSLSLTQSFSPILLSGVRIDPQEPFQLTFVLDRGDSGLRGDALKPEADKLVRYFMAALTIPEKDIWVNLSPYEPDRTIPHDLGLTDMGKDLLSQDYVLKQLTASLAHPQGEHGRKFWDTVYKKAYEAFGTTQIPVDTLNKVWIIPEKAVVLENAQGASVAEAKLKVMLEEDYLALERSSEALNVKRETQDASRTTNDVSRNAFSSQIVREILLPLLEKEVNEGKHFAPLRQIYSAIILAAWYKTALKNSVLNHVYSDQQKISGIDIEDKKAAEKIYAQYLETFLRGANAFVQVDHDPITNKKIARKYFSGGITKFTELTGPSSILERRPADQLPSGPSIRVELNDTEQVISSGLIVSDLNPDTLLQIADIIPGSRLVGVKAVVDLATKKIFFFPTTVRHQAIVAEYFPDAKTPYEEIFGFELQINPSTRAVLGIQLNWRGAQEQVTTFENIHQATQTLLNHIFLSRESHLIRINNRIEYDRESVEKFNKDRSDLVYREMSAELATDYFIKNPEAADRMVHEIVDLLPYDPENLDHRGKISRTITHFAALVIADRLQRHGVETALIQKILDLLSGIQDPEPEEAEIIEKISDEILDSFLAFSFANDVRVIMDRATILSNPESRVAGPQELKNLSELVHDAIGTISATRLMFLTNQHHSTVQRQILPRICTDALSRQLSGDFDGMVDLTRGEAVFFPRLKNGIPREEFARFVLRRKGPFVVFQLKTSNAQKRSFLRSIEPVAILRLGQKDAILTQQENVDIRQELIKAESHLRSNLFLDRSLESFYSVPPAFNSPQIQIVSFNEQLDAVIQWVTSDRSDIPDVEPFLKQAFENVQSIIAQEKKSSVASPVGAGTQSVSAPIEAIANRDVVGGIDFDKQGFLETISQEGTRTVFSVRGSLSRDIKGLKPVIVMIQDEAVFP
ncbi:MAG TPA: hypothetical protein PLO93_00910 [Candidatus Omnitrophota bacterium]|nr:hypothetical protein [Candidatus Omnitrophota bacterium]HQL40838.1 hypothetical protein [Candidatus Omnitrophota bacterium]